MDASYLQTSFLGGKWSVTAQGRADEEGYRTALNESFNALPIEAGAHTRRPGTQNGSTTRHGLPGIIREFHFSQSAPFNLEFTDGHVRIWAGTDSLLLERQYPVAAISAVSPAVVATTQATVYNTGDEVEFILTPNLGASPAGPAPLFNRQFVATVIDSQHFSLTDPVTGAAINGAALNLAGWTVGVARVVDFATPYVFGTAWSTTQLRVVQDEDVAFVLVPGFSPYALENVGTTNAPTFTWTQPIFLDGPYLDPPTDGSTLTPNAQSGTITLTASAITSINNGLGFQSTDVGRFIRLLSEPSNWSSGTGYTAGQQVRFETGAGPAYYQAIVANTGIEPDTDDGTNWAISTTAAAWTWAIIQTVVNTGEVTATVQPSAIDVFQQPLAGGSLVHLLPVTVWRLGAWGNTPGWPTAGGFFESRFYFAGPVKNSFAATMSEEDYNFAPTLLDGTVADNNGFSESIKAEDVNTIFWVAPTAEGLILGTQGGEWHVSASSLGEPLTPTSISAHRVTKYGCANVEPRYTGLSYVFVQRYQKQVYEYLADVYSRKFQGTNIARRARDLTKPGVVEIAYQYENAPVIWARTAENQLIGCTYKRESPFSTQPASFMGWHHHTLGSGRNVESISSGPSADGSVDSLAMVTVDLTTGIRYVEFMTSVFEEGDAITDAWFLDGALTPEGAQVVGNTIVFYGLDYLDGKTVTAWIGGVDAGDYTVTSGSITVPINAAGSLLTTALLETLTSENDFGTLGLNMLVTPAGAGWQSPVGTATNFTGTGTPNTNTPNMSAMIDWVGGFVYVIGPEINSATTGLTKFALNAPAVQLGYENLLDIGFNTSENNQVCGQDGNCYLLNSALNGLIKVVGATMARTQQDLSGYGVSFGGQTTTLQAGNQTYILLKSIHGINAAAFGSNYGYTFYLWNGTSGIPPLGNPGVFYIDHGQIQANDGDFNSGPCRFIRGASFTVNNVNYGSAFILESSPDDNTNLYIHSVSVDEGGGNIGAVITGSIAAATIESDWTKISICGGVYDPADGGLLVCLLGQGGAAHPAYIVKLQPNGAVTWKVAIDSGLVFSDNSQLEGHTFTGVSSSSVGSGFYRCYTFNTLTGAVTHIDENAEAPANVDQYTSDVLGQIVANAQASANWSWFTFGPAAGGGEITPAGYYTAPAVIGFNYVSQGQILRPLIPQDVGTQNGPALGKTRRSHMYAALLVDTQGVQVGTDFTKMRTVKLLTPGRTVQLAANVLFTGISQETLEDTASFDSMWAWQTLRPYPTTIASVECFVHGQDR